MTGLSPTSFLPRYGLTVPPPMRVRKLSLRAFSGDNSLAAAALVDGRDLESELEKLFARQDVAYIHAHYAAPSCYAARIERAQATRSTIIRLESKIRSVDDLLPR